MYNPKNAYILSEEKYGLKQRCLKVIHYISGKSPPAAILCARDKITKKKINMYYIAKINIEIYIDASRRAIMLQGIYLF